MSVSPRCTVTCSVDHPRSGSAALARRASPASSASCDSPPSASTVSTVDAGARGRPIEHGGGRRAPGEGIGGSPARCGGQRRGPRRVGRSIDEPGAERAGADTDREGQRRGGGQVATDRDRNGQTLYPTWRGAHDPVSCRGRDRPNNASLARKCQQKLSVDENISLERLMMTRAEKGLVGAVLCDYKTGFAG